MRPLLLAVLLLISASPAHAEPLAKVTAINGSPAVVRDGKREALQRGAALGAADEITTDKVSKVELALADKSVLDIGPETRVRLGDLQVTTEARTGRLAVLAGRFKLAVAKFLGTTDWEVETPTAVAGVRGTVLWGDTQLDAICALEGHVEVRVTKGTAVAEVGAGTCVRDMAKQLTTPFAPTAQQLDAYLKEVTLQ